MYMHDFIESNNVEIILCTKLIGKVLAVIHGNCWIGYWIRRCSKIEGIIT